MITFSKMHGLGNDFVLLDLDNNPEIEFTTSFVQFLCDRKYGIGADQLVTIKSIPNHKVKMGIYNNDGSISNACGNATRCIALYLSEKHNQKTWQIESLLGDIINTEVLEGDMVKSQLPAPKFNYDQIPLSKNFIESIEFYDFPNLPKGYFVNVGNPHIVFFVDNINKINILHYGKIIESHEYFPEKVNVNFAEIVSKSHINLKTYERGTGLTLACGTGAAATAVCAIKYMEAEKSVKVSMMGGDLIVNYENSIINTEGSATKVFDGIIPKY